MFWNPTAVMGVLGQDSQPDHEAGMVVDQAHDAGLDVALAAEVDEERTFDVTCQSPLRHIYAGTQLVACWPIMEVGESD
jgi:hypothetical protein